MKNILINNLQLLMLKKQVNGIELSNKTGVPQPTISRILSETSNNPRVSTLRKLADYFEVSLEDLCSKPINPLAEHFNNVPFIDQNMAAEWIKDKSKIEVSEHIMTSLDISDQSFALYPNEDLPINFFKQQNSILIFDPAMLPKSGDIVILKVSKTGKCIIRQLIIDLDHKYTRSIDPALNLPEHLTKLDAEDKVVAKLVQIRVEAA